MFPLENRILLMETQCSWSALNQYYGLLSLIIVIIFFLKLTHYFSKVYRIFATSAHHSPNTTTFKASPLVLQSIEDAFHQDLLISTFLCSELAPRCWKWALTCIFYYIIALKANNVLLTFTLLALSPGAEPREQIFKNSCRVLNWSFHLC